MIDEYLRPTGNRLPIKHRVVQLGQRRGVFLDSEVNGIDLQPRIILLGQGQHQVVQRWEIGMPGVDKGQDLDSRNWGGQHHLRQVIQRGVINATLGQVLVDIAFQFGRDLCTAEEHLITDHQNRHGTLAVLGHAQLLFQAEQGDIVVGLLNVQVLGLDLSAVLLIDGGQIVLDHLDAVRAGRAVEQEETSDRVTGIIGGALSFLGQRRKGSATLTQELAHQPGKLLADLLSADQHLIADKDLGDVGQLRRNLVGFLQGDHLLKDRRIRDLKIDDIDQRTVFGEQFGEQLVLDRLAMLTIFSVEETEADHAILGAGRTSP